MKRINCYCCGKFISDFDHYWHKTIYGDKSKQYSTNHVSYYCKKCYEKIDIPEKMNDYYPDLIYPTYSYDRYWNIERAKEECRVMKERIGHA